MVSEATKEVIRGLLVLDPNQRFTCKQVLTRLTAIVSGPIVENLQVGLEHGRATYSTQPTYTIMYSIGVRKTENLADMKTSHNSTVLSCINISVCIIA